MNKEQHLALNTELAKPAYTGLTDQEKADALNALTVPNFKKVDYADVASYLMVVGKYIEIIDSSVAAAREFTVAMNTFKTFDLSNPIVSAKIDSTFTALAAEATLTFDTADKDAIMALADDPISIGQDIANIADVKDYQVTNAENYNG